MECRIFCVGAVVLSSLFLVEIAGAAPSNRRNLTVEPSISLDATFGTGVDEPSRMRWGFLCYAYRTGVPRSCRLTNFQLGTVEDAVNKQIVQMDCQIDSLGDVVPGTCANGGHKHTRNSAQRPRTRIFASGNDQLIVDQDPINQAILEFTSFDEANAPFERFVVRGELPSLRWSFIFGPAPDNAGSFFFELRAEPPPCYFLPLLCGFTGSGAQEDGTYIADGVMNVRFDVLWQLPVDPSLYLKVRGEEVAGDGDDLRHLNSVAFGGTPRTLVAMRFIATQYMLDTGNKLRPNDLSLPYGGLFDVRAEYRYRPGGHRSHRKGEDIDLNQGVITPNGVSTIPCENDIDLHEAVHKVLAPEPGRVPRKGPITVQGQGGTTFTINETALLCEEIVSGSNIFPKKHIDVTQLRIPPFLP